MNPHASKYSYVRGSCSCEVTGSHVVTRVTNNVCHMLEIWVQTKMIDDTSAIIVQAVAFAAAEILHKEESSVSSHDAKSANQRTNQQFCQYANRHLNLPFGQHVSRLLNPHGYQSLLNQPSPTQNAQTNAQTNSFTNTQTDL